MDELLVENRRINKINKLKGKAIQEENRAQILAYKYTKQENLSKQAMKREVKLVETTKKIHNQVVEKRKADVAYTKKWEDFRINREITIKEYAKAKQKPVLV